MTQAAVRREPAIPRARLPRRHPLSASVRRVNRTVDWPDLQFDDATDGSWHRCDQVLRDPEFFLGWQQVLADDLRAGYGDAPQRTLDGYLLHWYLRIPALTGALLLHQERRVPGLAPRRLAFRLDSAVVSDVALRPGRFWCVPDDPAAEHPDATVVADLDELAAVLREQVVAHAARFLRLYGPLTRFGRHTLWAAVSDVLDSGLLLAGDVRGRPEEGVVDARRVLTGAGPLTASTTYISVDPAGAERWTRRRRSCCFYFALPGVEQACPTCPRVGDDERARMLAATDP